MKSNFQRTAEWLQNCGKGKTVENLSVQIGCDIEEYCEFLRTLSVEKEGYQKLIQRTCDDLEWFASKLKRRDLIVRIPADKRVEALDALCDRDVTGNGVAYLADFDKEEADEEVLNSNDAKLVDGKPIILEGGKIGKPQGWLPPNLKKFV
jgi:predicted HAD superfamily Cof-like phosphohydrolase